MISLNMSNSFEFNFNVINSKINDNKIGNFALGSKQYNDFTVLFVGMSQDDLKATLKEHLRVNSKYTHFKFSYAETVKEAFEKECVDYHTFKNSVLNEYHPSSPVDFDYSCPVDNCEFNKI